MKSYTDLEQSKKLTEILPIESADMEFMFLKRDNSIVSRVPFIKDGTEEPDCSYNKVPAWSLAALLGVIKDKCDYFECVYLKQTSDDRANPLEDVYRLSTDVNNVYNKESIDAAYEMVCWLKENNYI